MAEFIHSNRSESKGPFLVDRSQLETLDRLLQEEWERFDKARTQALEEEVESEFKEEREQTWNQKFSDSELRSAVRETLI